MTVTVWTNHREVCLSLMFNHASLFTEHVQSDGGDDSLIWFQYTTDELKPFWKSWLKSAKRIGLVYGGEVK